jgi:putative aldouronate transport system permease protein
MSIPESLEESAKIDGAHDIVIWARIILPLSKPVLATIALWVAVYHWNAYFDALIYITDQSKTVIQVILRRILLEDQIDFVTSNQFTEFKAGNQPTGEMVKAAIIMVATVPIVIVYPFLQKYFVKGIMLGSVKE